MKIIVGSFILLYAFAKILLDKVAYRIIIGFILFIAKLKIYCIFYNS